MKYKKISIETDGTFAGTKVVIDDKIVDLLQQLDFFVDINNVFATINIQVARQKDGNAVVKKVKVRNLSTEKFELKDEAVRVPLSLERTV